MDRSGWAWSLKGPGQKVNGIEPAGCPVDSIHWTPASGQAELSTAGLEFPIQFLWESHTQGERLEQLARAACSSGLSGDCLSKT